MCPDCGGEYGCAHWCPRERARLIRSERDREFEVRLEERERTARKLGELAERRRVVAIVKAHRDWTSENGRFRKDERDLIVGTCDAILKDIEKETGR